MESPKVLICTERSGPVYELEFRKGVVDSLIADYTNERIKGFPAEHTVGHLSALRLESENLAKALSRLKPLTPAQAVEKLAYHLSVWDRSEWDRIQKLIEGKCSTVGCDEWVASEDGWTPDSKDLADEYCMDHLSDIVEGNKADNDNALAKETVGA